MECWPRSIPYATTCRSVVVLSRATRYGSNDDPFDHDHVGARSRLPAGPFSACPLPDAARSEGSDRPQLERSPYGSGRGRPGNTGPPFVVLGAPTVKQLDTEYILSRPHLVDERSVVYGRAAACRGCITPSARRADQRFSQLSIEVALT